MLVTLLGMVTLVRLVQPENASVPDAGDAVGDGDAGQAGAARERRLPMLVTLLGIVTLVRLVQSRTPSPRCGDAVGIVTLVRLVQSENAPSPMVVTLLGMVTLVRLVQPENA